MMATENRAHDHLTMLKRLLSYAKWADQLWPGPTAAPLYWHKPCYLHSGVTAPQRSRPTAKSQIPQPIRTASTHSGASEAQPFTMFALTLTAELSG